MAFATTKFLAGSEKPLILLKYDRTEIAETIDAAAYPPLNRCAINSSTTGIGVGTPAAAPISLQNAPNFVHVLLYCSREGAVIEACTRLATVAPRSMDKVAEAVASVSDRPKAPRP